jgi:hypothetical protein
MRSASRAACSAEIGLRSSSSTRTTCWLCATTRVFTVVGRSGSTSRWSGEIPRSFSAAVSSRPASSAPITPTRSGVPPRLATLTATLAAPPGTTDDRRLWTTGTGASGDSRSTVPHQ